MKAAIFSILFVFVASNSWGQDSPRRREKKPDRDPDHLKRSFSVGANIGLHYPTLSSLDGAFAAGFNAGFMASDQLMIGIYYQRSVQDVGSGVDVSLDAIGADIVNFFHKMFFFGMQIGLIVESASVSGASAEESEFALGPKFGLVYYLDPLISIGLEPGGFFVQGDPKTYFLFQVPATIRFWF